MSDVITICVLDAMRLSLKVAYTVSSLVVTAPVVPTLVRVTFKNASGVEKYPIAPQA